MSIKETLNDPESFGKLIYHFFFHSFFFLLIDNICISRKSISPSFHFNLQIHFTTISIKVREKSFKKFFFKIDKCGHIVQYVMYFRADDSSILHFPNYTFINYVNNQIRHTHFNRFLFLSSFSLLSLSLSSFPFILLPVKL